MLGATYSSTHLLARLKVAGDHGQVVVIAFDSITTSAAGKWDRDIGVSQFRGGLAKKASRIVIVATPAMSGRHFARAALRRHSRNQLEEPHL